MPISEKFKIKTKSPYLYLTAYKGHFATSHSHTNYYIDITSQKSCLSEAKAVAKALAADYKYSDLIDTVLCLDGTEVIGAVLANELTKVDVASINSNQEIYILTPEHTTSGQLLFRDNIVNMITGKRVLILTASVVTGGTAFTAIEAVNYYSGTVVGIASIFSTVGDCDGVQVTSVFNPHDIPDYISNPSIECPMCKQGERIEALINSYGFSKL